MERRASGNGAAGRGEATKGSAQEAKRRLRVWGPWLFSARIGISRTLWRVRPRARTGCARACVAAPRRVWVRRWEWQAAEPIACVDLALSGALAMGRDDLRAWHAGTVMETLLSVSPGLVSPG